MRIGSLSASAPGGISNEVLPPTVTGWTVPGTTAAPEPATATVTWPISSGIVPNTFVSTSRTESPPALVNTMLRTVWLLKPVAARVPGVATWGLALQLVTQSDWPDVCEGAAAEPELAVAAVAAATASGTAAPKSPMRIRVL